jgi:Dolichyl-phosphate-mannose-protein mannosyltransferase
VDHRATLDDTDRLRPDSVETPNVSAAHRTVRGLSLRPRAPLICVAVFAIATVLVQGYRLHAGPDVFGDEGAYLQVGRHLAGGAGLTVGYGNGVFLWHPPLYMLIEAAVIKVSGLGSTDPLSLLFAVRWINIVFSAATAGLLVWLAYKMRGLRMGVIVGLLFLLDPYVQRIDRRSMLETATIFFVLLGLYLFTKPEVRRHWLGWLGAGIAFGLAIVTKEPAAVFLLVPIILSLSNPQLGPNVIEIQGKIPIGQVNGTVKNALFLDRQRLLDAVRAVAVAASIYLSYVAAMVIAGHGSLFLRYKEYDLARLSHALFGTHLGPSPSGGTLQTAHKVLSSDNLLMLVQRYGSSYVLIGLALIGIVVLLARYRNDAGARLLAVWMTISAVSAAVVVRTSDQYFYYLIVPAVLVDGYVLAAALERCGSSIPRRALAAAAAVVLVACCAYGGYRWVTNYVTGSDDCYTRIVNYVRAHVPEGQTVVSSNEVSNYFLADRYKVRLDRAPSVITARDERYFIMSSKDRWARNQDTTPRFYDWVVRNSRSLVLCRDTTYWKLGLYHRSGDKAPAPNVGLGDHGSDR